jgi:serine protease inhibitor
MVVDRPFLYSIAERKSGTLLFLGIAMQPDTNSRMEANAF